MRAIKWVMGFLLAWPMAVQADDATFWRVQSANTSVVTTIDMNGTIAWSNSVQGNSEQVQRATTLSPIADWQDYVLVPATGSATSVQAFDLHPPANMVLIPAGSFVMGNATNMFPTDEALTELPQHTVNVSAFYMDKYEVTKALWDEVAKWAATNNYDITAGGGSGKASNHPVQTVTWYECVKWCNARSQRDGLMPCYTTNGSTYKTGDDSNVVCNWAVSGYRLPTEAEWEKAARGGVADTRFPWTDYTNNISHAKANYYAYPADYSYDVNPVEGANPAYTNGGSPYSSPVGSFAPNGYGLYDTAGNVWEWCWDWYSSSYYSSSPSTNPKGVDSGLSRVPRGGGWVDYAYLTRVAARGDHQRPTYEYSYLGFRCVRGL